MEINLNRYINKQTSIAPLVVFRILFGFMMAGSAIRFWANGWIDSQFIQPSFFFHYYGFSWVEPLDSLGMYIVFGIMILSAVGVAIGAFYRFSSSLYFLSFTYVELIDITNYLNHYYFVSLMAFIMIFLPAHRRFSIDVYRNPETYRSTVSKWTIDIVRLQLGIVYFYAGIAKINYDWLIKAQPLRLWLASRTDLFIIGPLLKYKWVAYVFSWFGCIYDLTIPIFLSFKKTRWVAYIAVIVFHIATSILFPIGMFPYIMILSTLIFFSDEFHEKIIIFLSRFFSSENLDFKVERGQIDSIPQKIIKIGFASFLVFQLLFPFRYLLYPDNLFWTEQGFRFSWRVMLIEKSGMATFYVEDAKTKRKIEVINSNYLTPLQEKMMATQPDLILQYAHFLGKEFKSKGVNTPKVFVNAFVTLNGRSSKQYINPSVDLMTLEDSFQHKSWILPFKG
ncbi:HTTM domain-containing protein [Flammeovirga agarivorans]|uniref:HTTM domain-containing protein n=1 Tax=Flammeovirga agarivorans TaxID=2726742 RepID=A0A7X8SL64_9BACT|nr:HTTM domain-containing protein [Flammeovirga agarivorans]NLR92280.1 HTTM domain-containing protein [Flammeovirga agarivorans]